MSYSIPSLSILGCSALLSAAAPAQDISISDANVQFAVEFNSSPSVYVATADFLKADPAGDAAGVLFKTAWAYRIHNDAREHIFHDGSAQATYSSVGNVGTATWANVDARSLISAVCTYTAQSTGPSSGGVIARMAITNISATAITLNVYHLTDLDVGGAAYATNVASTGSDGHQIVSSGSSPEWADHAAIGADHWELGSYTGTTNPMGGACTYASLVDLYTRLENNAVDTLRDDACPWGPVDYRGAYQWQDRVLQPNQTETFVVILSHNTPGCFFDSTTYGSGIAGAGGVPVLGSVGGARLGHDFVPTVDRCPAGAASIVFIGLLPTSVPFFDYTFLTDVNVAYFNLTADASGHAQASPGVPVPNQVIYCGASVFGQAFVLDATSTSTSGLPLTQSAGVRWTLGSYR